MSNLGLVLDCADPERLANFWAPALGYEKHGVAGNYVILVDQAGSGPKLILQGVPEPKSAKNRMHLDIVSSDIEAEAARLVAIGARQVRPEPFSEHGCTFSEHGCTWLLMLDPEGNEFCVCDGGAPGP
jgi:predicted enzyme related to lactoylglutathione lyase